MRTRARVAICVVFILGSISITDRSSHAQDQSPSSSVNIYYTSQLYGYFRSPDIQPADSTEGCVAAEGVNSPAADAFFKLERQKQVSDGVLVGTGNNFAPVLWARQFSQPPDNQYRGTDIDPATLYKRNGKELFVWYPALDQWVTNEYVNKLWNDETEIMAQKPGTQRDPDSLPAILRRGRGFVPTDNVACFLRRAGYTAIVPGKYDFYFGPERLRELARLLASPDENLRMDGVKFKYKPVQMLGANLVIETTWKSDHKPVGDNEDPPPFAIWKQGVKYHESTSGDRNAAAPAASTEGKRGVHSKPGNGHGKSTPASPTVPFPTNPTDGKKVYPWFPGAELELGALSESGQLLANLKHQKPVTQEELERYLCSEILRIGLVADGCSPKADSGRHDESGRPEPDSQDNVVDAIKNTYQTELLQLYSSVHKFDTRWVYLCNSVARKEQKNGVGDPNDVFIDQDHGCLEPLSEIQKPEVRVKGTSVEYFYPFPARTSFSTLDPGTNHGLCVKTADLLQTTSKNSFYCIRFSVYTPFFESPNGATLKDCGRQPQECPYVDPQPYAVVKSQNGSPSGEVAVFGVVDPNLGQQVGFLNFAWKNVADLSEDSDDTKYKTTTAVNDPGEALQEIVGFFDLDYTRSNERPFSGTRVLLAQMTPEEAQKLAARVGGFDAVVSDADPDLSAVNELRTATWLGVGPRTESKSHHAFLAVPQPYWVANNHPNEHVDIGRLTIESGSRDRFVENSGFKNFAALHYVESRQPSHVQSTDSGPGPDWSLVNAPDNFWSDAIIYLSSKCKTVVPIPVKSNQRISAMQVDTGSTREDHSVMPLDDTLPDSVKQDVLQSLTSCAVQKELGADVVLLQKRDFYLDWQQRTPPKSFTSVQEFLDRVIWKGDFTTLLYVPGTTLQSVMKLSDAFDADDKSTLSLSNETDRGLIAKGIRKDTKGDGYIINDLPIDPTRIYAVATTDFIAAGDTGYPDLATNSIRKFATPSDFDKEMKGISAVVCRGLEQSASKDECMDWLDQDAYFDELAMRPTDPRNGATLGPRLWEWSVLDQSKRLPVAKAKSAKDENVDTFIQDRRVESTRINQPDTTLFALNDAALNLNMLDHRFSDAGLSNFTGNPAPQLAAKRSHAAGFDVQPKFVYSWHRFQFFENTEFIYNVQDTGNANAPRTVNQKENLFSSDTGLSWEPLPFESRAVPNLEIVGSFHYETQLIAPTAATLAPLPKADTFPLGVSFPRTHYLLPRVGLRHTDRTSWIEAGLEDGAELQAVRVVVPKSGNVFNLNRPNIRASGTYWRWHLVVPFSQTTSWTVDEDGDYFFNAHGDASTDTHFRSDTKTSLNFQVFPSLSFAPTYEFFYYENKSCPMCTERGLLDQRSNWFWQNQASIQMKVRFDFWNRNRWFDQLSSKPPSGAPAQ